MRTALIYSHLYFTKVNLQCKTLHGLFSSCLTLIVISLIDSFPLKLLQKLYYANMVHCLRLYLIYHLYHCMLENKCQILTCTDMQKKIK